MESRVMSRNTNLDDLPDVILLNIFSLILDTRTRNSMSLVCQKWRYTERSTRTTLAIRGNVRNLSMIPFCFESVKNLDISLLSPWGSPHPSLLPQFLRRIFPDVDSLTVYARTPSTLQNLAPHWPNLRHVKLVRWHQRLPSPIGSDFIPLFQHCSSLTSLDLSHFYCWSEDLPPALQAYPSVSASLTFLNLLTLSSFEGFKSHELVVITSSCPNLNGFLAGCMFDPRYIDFVGDEALLALASKCPLLSHLHLADTSSLSNVRGDPDHDGFTPEDAGITQETLKELFSGLPLLEILVLDVCQNVRDSGFALEMLKLKCPKLKSLKLGQFHGICKSVGSNQGGIVVCEGLESLSIKNSADLTDSDLMAICLGCPKLAKFEIQGCKKITEIGLKNLACVLRRTLVDVKISCCKNLNAASTLRALEPIRRRIQRLHIDCVWDGLDLNESSRQILNDFDLNESKDEEASTSSPILELKCDFDAAKRGGNWDDSSKKKKCKYSTEINCSGYGYKSWDRLQYLSLWIAVGELLTPLRLAGLDSCPVLEEIKIRVEGDCRVCQRPTEEAFGLGSLEIYPQLLKMKLDCGDAIGYALTAPTGHMDLSLWERFFLNGIVFLNLNELDYWPPQDRDVNQRSISLPAAGLLAECTSLRKLFIHGTAHEHFMTFLHRIVNLRDVQLRADYYPAPEDDMSTEMRIESCRRFEEAFNQREILD